jgi:hypothetical protein
VHPLFEADCGVVSRRFLRWTGVVAVIEWGSEDWGGNVHYAANGSWVVDRHGDDSDDPDQ